MKSTLKPLLSHASDEYSTPGDIYAALHLEFGFEVDFASAPWNAKCERFFTIDDDALSQKWTGVGWLNPPFSKASAFLAKAAASARAGTATVVALIPARTETKYFLSHAVLHAHEIRFVVGRLRFGIFDDATGVQVIPPHHCPFPTTILIYRPGPPPLNGPAVSWVDFSFSPPRTYSAG